MSAVAYPVILHWRGGGGVGKMMTSPLPPKKEEKKKSSLINEWIHSNTCGYIHFAILKDGVLCLNWGWGGGGGSWTWTQEPPNPPPPPHHCMSSPQCKRLLGIYTLQLDLGYPATSYPDISIIRLHVGSSSVHCLLSIHIHIESCSKQTQSGWISVLFHSVSNLYE